MIEPYQALGLVPTMRGIRRREEIQTNLEHLSHLIKAASWLSSLDLPVRLIAVPEGALQGFNDRFSTSTMRSSRGNARLTSRARRPTSSAGWPGSGKHS
jgi:hypothetical protein